jgi:AcrR family transcriptional regulator
MTMPKDMDKNMGTRDRLLTVAGEIFSEKGFEKATVREIVKRAKTNLNAVNYHFRDKEQLYVAVLLNAHKKVTHYMPSADGPMADLSPEQRLRGFVSFFLQHVFEKGKRAWQMKLMLQELANPTSAMDMLVEQNIRPRAEYLFSIIQELVGKKVPPEKVRLFAISIIGQCVHVCLAQPVIMRLNPNIKYEPADVEMLADHITQFSLAAIRTLSKAYIDGGDGDKKNN